MFPVTPETITAGLALLTLVDLFLAVWILVFPRSFLDHLHGTEVKFDLALTRRTGGFWVGFTLLQGLALFFWSSYPGLLLLVAGVRLTECLADWIFLSGPYTFSVLGTLGYLASVPYTIFFGFVFLYQASTVPEATLTVPSVLTTEVLRIGRYPLFGILVVSIGLDFIRGIVAVGYPDEWFRFLHGEPGEEPQGLLRRAGGVWLGMGFVELTVLLGGLTNPMGLLVVAGMRLTDVLPDVFYAGTSERYAAKGWSWMILVPPLNVLLVLMLCSST